ncbi:hypothetical protein Btru_073898 [Bulinus truncatus]|nr:hypothetical protein Btru_073898 [Bulinus truncatus]
MLFPVLKEKNQVKSGIDAVSQTTSLDSMMDAMTSYNQSTSRLDGVSDASGYTTDMSGPGAALPAVADYAGRLVLRLNFCQRVSPPPPVPPWLMETPEKLRTLVANCSSWRKYTDLCSLHIPPDYPQALTDISHAGSPAIRWIPFIVVIFLVTVIVLSAIILYNLYRTNRMKFTFLTKIPGASSPPPHNYCLPTGSMTPSVTIETQLSVCALEDDCTLASMTPLHLAYTDRMRYALGDLAGPRAEQSDHRSPTRELLLHPAALPSCDNSAPQYVSDLSGTQYYSSQSLPILTDRSSSLSKNGGRRRLSDDGSLGYDSDDTVYSNYVRIHTRRRDDDWIAHDLNSVSSNKKAVTAGSKTVRGIVKRCQKAGVYIVHGVLGHHHKLTPATNNGPVHHHQPKPHVKPFPAFTKIRRSFKNLQLPYQRSFSHSKSFHNGLTSHENLDSKGEADAECGNSAVTEVTARPDLDNRRSRIKASVLNRLRPLSRATNREIKQSREATPEQSQRHDYSNPAFGSHTDIRVMGKVKRSPFKKISQVPNLIRNFTKHRGSVH